MIKKRIPSENKKGICLMLTASVLTCTGQLCWKLSAEYGGLLIICGFALYGVGALLMVIALKYGEVSVLHPILSTGYILSLILGVLVLHENAQVLKVVGISVILIGLVLLSSSREDEKQ